MTRVWSVGCGGVGGGIVLYKVRDKGTKPRAHDTKQDMLRSRMLVQQAGEASGTPGMREEMRNTTWRVNQQTRGEHIGSGEGGEWGLAGG